MEGISYWETFQRFENKGLKMGYRIKNDRRLARDKTQLTDTQDRFEHTCTTTGNKHMNGNETNLKVIYGKP